MYQPIIPSWNTTVLLIGSYLDYHFGTRGFEQQILSFSFKNSGLTMERDGRDGRDGLFDSTLYIVATVAIVAELYFIQNHFYGQHKREGVTILMTPSLFSFLLSFQIL